MSEFLTSSQYNEWMMKSVDVYKENVRKSQKTLIQKVDKYSNKPTKAGEKPIYEVVNYNYQQYLLAYCIHELYYTYGRAKLNLPPKILVNQ